MDSKQFFLLLTLLLAFSLPGFGLTPENNTESVAAMEISENISIAFMISVLALKITAFIIGFFVIKLGHDTLVKGITGEFDFGFSGSGIKTKLKSASPGTFFVLMGTAIIIWSMVAEKPLKINTQPQQTIEQTVTDPVGTEEQKGDIPE